MATIAEIMDFFQTGGTVEEIEQRTGIPAGEVQDVLSAIPELAPVLAPPIPFQPPGVFGVDQFGAAPTPQELIQQIPTVQQQAAVQQQVAPAAAITGFTRGFGGVAAIPAGAVGALPTGGGLVAQPGEAEAAAAREAQRFQQAIGGLQAQQQAIGESPLFQAAGGFAQDVLGGQRLPIGAGTQAQILQQFQEANIERAGAQQGINRLIAGASGLGRGGDLQARQATSLQNLARQQGAAQRDVAIRAALANFQAQQQAATQARQVAGTQFGLQQPFVQQQAGELIARREVVTPDIAGGGGEEAGMLFAQRQAARQAAIQQLSAPFRQPQVPIGTGAGFVGGTGAAIRRTAVSTTPTGFGFTPTDVRRR